MVYLWANDMFCGYMVLHSDFLGRKMVAQEGISAVSARNRST